MISEATLGNRGLNLTLFSTGLGLIHWCQKGVCSRFFSFLLFTQAKKGKRRGSTLGKKWPITLELANLQDEAVRAEGYP